MIWNTKEERILKYPNNALGFEAVGSANIFVFTFLEVSIYSSNNRDFLVSLHVHFAGRYFNNFQLILTENLLRLMHYRK